MAAQLLSSLLPQNTGGGYLPYFLMWQSMSAAIHSVVCYTSRPDVALKAFSGPGAPPAHALLAHTYGVKNVYTSLIRLYAAYHIANQPVYDLAVASFAGVLLLYVPEYLVYRTARLREAAFPFVLGGLSLAWMVLQRSWYLGLEA